MRQHVSTRTFESQLLILRSMNEDLRNEVEAINSIYGVESLVVIDESDIYVLHLPQQSVSLRLRFPAEYPATPPAVLGTQSSGEHTRRGEATHIVEVFRDALGELFQPGEVCLFDVIEAVINILESSADEPTISSDQDFGTNQSGQEASRSESVPQWILSEVVTELKSVFIARCASVSSPDQARRYVQHLLDSDKKVRSATHNITAWRIKGEHGIKFQDCDDDGEAAAGGRLLHLMQLMDLWDVMVVVTRWYGGHQLGPKRFSIINAVARDAFVKGNFLCETSMKKTGKR